MPKTGVIVLVKLCLQISMWGFHLYLIQNSCRRKKFWIIWPDINFFFDTQSHICSTFMSSFCLVKVFRSFPIGSIDSSSLSRRSIQFFTACKLTRHAASSPAFFCSSSQIWFFNLWKRIRKLQSRLDILLKNKDNQRKCQGGEQLPSQEKSKSLHSPICIPHKECYCLSRHLQRTIL